MNRLPAALTDQARRSVGSAVLVMILTACSGATPAGNTTASQDQSARLGRAIGRRSRFVG